MNQHILFFILTCITIGFLINSVLHTKHLPKELEPFSNINTVDGTFFFDGVHVGIGKKPNKNAFIDTNGKLRVKKGIKLKKNDGTIITLNRKDLVRLNEMMKTMYQDNGKMTLYDSENNPVTIEKNNLGILTGQLGYRIDYANPNERPKEKTKRSIFNFFGKDMSENSSPAQLHEFKFVNVPLTYRDMGPSMAVGPRDKDYFCQISLDKDTFGSLRKNNIMKLKEYDY